MNFEQELPDTQYSYLPARNTEDVDYQVDETDSSGATILLGRLDGGNDKGSTKHPSQPPKSQSIPLNDTVSNSNSNFKGSLGSSRSGSTLPFSQPFFDQVLNVEHYQEELGIRDGDAGEHGNDIEADDTQIMSIKSTKAVELATGEADSDMSDLAEIEDSGDDLDMRASQLVSQFPEEKRFQIPKTPASKGKKRFRNGDVVLGSEHGSASATTPRLPVNPFAQRGLADPKMMSLSQVFNATQAPSSPMVNVPTSDGIFDRPSPTGGQENPSDVHPDSSPAKLMRPTIKRNSSGSHSRFVSTRASQGDRDGIRTSPLMTSEPHYESDRTMDDDLAPTSSEERRNGERRSQKRARGSTRMTANAEGPAPLSRRTTQEDVTSNRDPVRSDSAAKSSASEMHAGSGKRRRAGNFNAKGATTGLCREDTFNALEPVPEADSHGEEFVAASDIDSDETNREASHGPEDDAHLSQTHGEVGKENIPSNPIQVPRTVSKKTRSRYIHIAQPQIDEGGLSPYRTDSQLVAVANSQPSEGLEMPPALSEKPIARTDAHHSPQVPDSTEVAVDGDSKAIGPGHRVGSNPSQQTATPPSSSPSPQKHTAANKSARETASEDSKDSVPRGPPEDELTSPSTPRPRRPRSARDKIPDTVDGRSSVFTRTPLTREPHSDKAATTPRKDMTDQPSLSNDQAVPREIQTRESEMARAQEQSKSMRPRKFADFVPEQSPLSQGLDFDITALSKEDQDFRDRMGQLPSSSPVRPAARRRTRPLELSKHVPLSNSQSSLSNPLPADSSEESAAARLPTSSLSQATVERPIPASQNALSQSQGSNSSEKENVPGTRRKRPVITSSLESDAAASRQLSQETEPLTDVEELLDRKESHRPYQKRLKTKPPKQNPYTPTQSEGTGLATEVSRQSSDLPFAPTRVWALFNGTPAGFYPAVCLGVAEYGRLRVRFEDGKEDVVPSSSVRRLEIRIGDSVKVDNGRASKSNTFSVESLEESLRAASQPGRQTVGTDTNGWSKVKLALKHKDGSLASQQEPVPISCLYLTKTLFNRLRDRDFDHSSAIFDVPREITPSSCRSVTDTPLSRRRARTSVKNENSIHRSFKSSIGKVGLFSGMAFAVTAVEKAKRPELESSVVSNGGTLLASGLESLFNVPEKRLTQSSDNDFESSFVLEEESKTIGFTALLADRHCRTMNYLYALALNVPCISVCWVRDCITQSRILDWRHYLLPSGEVQMLDGAVVSRMMEIPQEFSSPASSIHWSVESMFHSRRKPFWKQNVLLLCSKGKEKEKDHQAFVFILYALGAEMVCVAPGEKEAEDYLQSRMKWHWICLSEDEGDSSRRRNRKPDLGIKWRDGVRTIKTEFVVQSLLLGRLMDE